MQCSQPLPKPAAFTITVQQHNVQAAMNYPAYNAFQPRNYLLKFAQNAPIYTDNIALTVTSKFALLVTQDTHSTPHQAFANS